MLTTRSIKKLLVKYTPGGGGGVLPHISYRYVLPDRVGFLRRFVLKIKRVYTLPILVWNRVWFSRKVPQRMNVFIISMPNVQERKRNANSKWI